MKPSRSNIRHSISPRTCQADWLVALLRLVFDTVALRRQRTFQAVGRSFHRYSSVYGLFNTFQIFVLRPCLAK